MKSAAREATATASTAPASEKLSSAHFRTALTLGFGLFGAQLMWMVYNTYMPIFLQAGAAGFSTSLTVRGFGLSATLTGIIMTFDNIAAFFLQPIMGPISDRTHTRFGRRIPYIMVFAPLSAIAFALIPVGALLIPPALSGQLAMIRGPFALLIGAALVMVLCMALWRTPLFALMPDLFPSALRSEANALINIMSGIGGIIAFVAGGLLFSLNPGMPFWFGSLITLLAVLVVVLKIREPSTSTENTESRRIRDILQDLRRMPSANRTSLVLLVLTVFGYMLGYMAIETFFSSFAVSTMGMKPSAAAMLLSVSYVSFLIFAMPSSTLAKRWGRKRTVLAGLVIFGLGLVVIWLFPSVPVVVAMLVVGGFGWALVNINCYPMILDTSVDDSLMGTFSGLYFIATTLAGTLGPIFNGWIIDLTGRNYAVIFLVCPLFFLFSFLCLSRVTTGEIKA
ncbi:MAG: MFS transporter [Spirochaetales bacterium]|nr:MFS transporter [Spirochaetales bacterium]